MAETRRFAGLATRSELKSANQLGVILRSEGNKAFRRNDLDILDAYYEGRQYDGLMPWNQTEGPDSSYIPIRDRRPPLQFGFIKLMTSRIGSKLIGRSNYPRLTIEEDPSTEQYLKAIEKASHLRAALIEPSRRAMTTGSVLIRFSIVEGSFKIEHFLSKWCFPEMDAAGALEKVRIKYVYDDNEDLDEKKKPKKKWFQMDLGKMKDIKYDNPEFSKDAEPKFKVVATADHKLGFVQAEWMRTAEQTNTIDGPSLVKDILPFVDEMNYSASQSSQAIQYNQDPQLLLQNMDEDEMEQMIRSSVKAWNLGREGEANFLEAGMSGVEAADNFRDKIRTGIQDLARVVLLDPEKVVGHAQSAKAMEVLHGPMIELVDELRPQFEKTILNLTLKMALTNLIQDQRGANVPVAIPAGYKPMSLNVVVVWPPIFPQTMEDLQKKVSVAVQAATGNLISRATLTKWLAEDFGVENVEEEVFAVDNQKVINPFGAF